MTTTDEDGQQSDGPKRILIEGARPELHRPPRCQRDRDLAHDAELLGSGVHRLGAETPRLTVIRQGYSDRRGKLK